MKIDEAMAAMPLEARVTDVSNELRQARSR
jgi:hypothetical protein